MLITRKINRQTKRWVIALAICFFSLPASYAQLGTEESPASLPPDTRLVAPNSGQNAIQSRSITFRIRDEPQTLDWNRAHTFIEANLLMNMMEGLVTFDNSMQVRYALAKSHSVSADGKIYTFYLRPDVKWSDGVPLKAQHFVDSWKRLLAPVTAAPYAYYLFDIEGAEAFNQAKIQDFSKVGVKALNDLTLQVRLSQPVSFWIMMTGFWVTFPIRQDLIDRFGAAWESPGRMVTLGAYNLISRDRNSKVVLGSNPNYFGERGNLQQITALVVKDDAAALALYEEGKLDLLTDLSSLDLSRLAGRMDLYSFPQLKTGYLGFVVNQGPLANVRFRRAIAMAIDKSKINSVLHGSQRAATSFVPPPLLGYDYQAGLPFDPDKAKAELQASGVVTSKPIILNYLIPNWNKQVTLAGYIQSELKKNLGIQVVLLPMDNKMYRNQLAIKSYPIFDYSWTADYPDPDNFLSLFSSDSGISHTGWKNLDFDRKVRQARSVQNATERKRLYQSLQKTLLEEQAVIVPLYYEPNTSLVKPRVKNFEINPMDYLFLKKAKVVP